MPRYDQTGPQGNGPRTGRGMGIRRAEQALNSDGETCKRMRRRQRMRNACEEGSDCNRNGNRVAGKGRRAEQNMQGAQGMRRRNNSQGQGSNAMGRGRIGFIDSE